MFKSFLFISVFTSLLYMVGGTLAIELWILIIMLSIIG